MTDIKAVYSEASDLPYSVTDNGMVCWKGTTLSGCENAASMIVAEHKRRGRLDARWTMDLGPRS